MQQQKLPDYIHGASVSHDVPIYFPAYTSARIYCLEKEANEQRIQQCIRSKVYLILQQLTCWIKPNDT